MDDLDRLVAKITTEHPPKMLRFDATPAEIYATAQSAWLRVSVLIAVRDLRQELAAERATATDS